MKTVEEVQSQVKKVKANDFFGTEIEELMRALPYEFISHLIVDGTSKEVWEEERYKTIFDAAQGMIAYLSFAYEKAYNKRGLSANRSISHLLGLSFLINDALYRKISYMYVSEYKDYGLHILRYCDNWLVDHYGIEAIDPRPSVQGIPD